MYWEFSVYFRLKSKIHLFLGEFFEFSLSIYSNLPNFCFQFTAILLQKWRVSSLRYYQYYRDRIKNKHPNHKQRHRHYINWLDSVSNTIWATIKIAWTIFLFVWFINSISYVSICKFYVPETNFIASPWSLTVHLTG